MANIAAANGNPSVDALKASKVRGSPVPCAGVFCFLSLLSAFALHCDLRLTDQPSVSQIGHDTPVLPPPPEPEPTDIPPLQMPRLPTTLSPTLSPLPPTVRLSRRFQIS